MSHPQCELNPSLRRSGVMRIIQVVGSLLLQAVLLFVSAGKIAWLGAWLYVGLYCAMLTASGIVLFRTNPELINVRGEIRPGVKRFDKVFITVCLPLYFVMMVVAGLDFRYAWSAMPFALTGLGIFLFVLATFTVILATAVNPYFEIVVRIQKDRGQEVITSGPYQYVRHPGYGAMLLLQASAPLILGSWVTFLPVILIVVLFIIRTLLEDRTLREELPNYAEYAARTRYRLLPGVW